MKNGKICDEMMDRYLAGERSEELMKHLAECPDCRALAALERMTAEKPARVEVPEHLDRAVKAYAAGRKRTAPQAVSFHFFRAHVLIPLAAAVMVCIGLAFAFQVPGTPGKAGSGQLVQKQKTGALPVYEQDSLDSELLLLSSRIRETSAQLNRTTVYSVIEEAEGGTNDVR